MPRIAGNNLLPIPYIERIYVLSKQTNDYTETTSDGIQVDLAIYLPSIDGAAPAEAREAINDIIFYVVFIVGSEQISNINNKEESIFNYMKKLTDSGKTIEEMRGSYAYFSTLQFGAYGVLTDGETEDPGIDEHAYCAQNYVQINFSDFSEEPELSEIIDDVQYYKYTASPVIPMWGDYITFNELLDVAYSETDGSVTYKNINVYAFSSALEANTVSNKSLINKVHSVLAYESLFIDGVIAAAPQQKFFSGQTIWNGIPMQTIDGVEHQSSLGEREMTIEKIYTIIPEEANTDEAQGIKDDLTYLLETEKNEPTLIVKLNQYRKAFPDKSTTSELGSLYNSFKEIVATENAYYNTHPGVSKRLVRNFKIIDGREDLAEENYEIPEVVTDLYPGTDHNSGGWQSDRIYEDALITRYAYSSVIQAGESSTETWEQEDSLLNYGFIWFDFEKALRNDTSMASVFNVDKLETYFGKAFTSQVLKFKYHTLARYYDGSPQYVMQTYYKAGEDNPDINYIEMTDVSDGSVATINYPYVDVGLEGITDYSYCMLRNFDLASTDDLEGYRLACFQFQDYEDLDSASDALVGLNPTSTAYIGAESYGTIEAYSFYLVMQDESEEILSLIIDGYYSTVYEEYQTYYDYANEFCSYNNIQGYFNEFFVNGINDLYSEEPEKAPWIRVPIIYNLHRDLLYNHFNGDINLILEDSRTITDGISPSSGNLLQVQALYDRLESLWTEFYADGGVVSDAVEAVSDADPERAYYQRFLSLPAIYYGGETEEDYEADVAETITGTYVMDAWSSSASYIEYELTEEEVKEEILSIVEQLYPIDVRYSYRSGESSYTATYNMSEVFSKYYVGTATTADWSDYYDNIDDREGANEYTYYTDTSRTEEIDASEVYTLEKELAMLAWPNSTSRSWGLIAMKSLLEDNGYTVV